MSQASRDVGNVATLFDLRGQTAAITGGSGVLGSVMARGLGRAGARVAVLSRRKESCEEVAETIRAEGGQAVGVACDVLDQAGLERAAEEVAGAFGEVDILVNGAGGNQPRATTLPGERSFFELDGEAVRGVFDLHLLGPLWRCQVFGRGMAG